MKHIPIWLGIYGVRLWSYCTAEQLHTVDFFGLIGMVLYWVKCGIIEQIMEQYNV